jgi:protein kinase A
MTHLSQPTLGALAAQFVEKKFPPKTDIITEGKMTGAALYFVRSGKVDIKSKSDKEWNRSVHAGGYFGEEMLELDVGGLKPSPDIVAHYTAKTLNEAVVIGILTLVQCRSIIDTTTLGKQKQSKIDMNGGDSNIPLDSLKRHKILGAGTFGQVWLVSHAGSDGQRRPYALKIQSKYELICNHQAKGVVQEKNIMQQLHHPFLTNLVQTYQDKQFIYMLVGLVQGGELFSLLHQTSYDGISEKDAKFYAAGILEGLSHMHRRHILYRDLKPENVLIDRDGYPVIIDFGFGMFAVPQSSLIVRLTPINQLIYSFFGDSAAKYVVNKTYTLCGTPLYLAPEVILNRGHDKGADHWSYATLLYEMIAGHTPFYTEGMDQIQLFRTICKAKFSFPPAGVMSMEVEDLIQRFFVLDPAKRLGSLARGINEIYAHTWYDEIDFGELRQKEIPAPWTPNIKDPLDTANFESWDHLEDKTKTQNPFISEEQQRIFKSF